jgi:hypothetical protein
MRRICQPNGTAARGGETWGSLARSRDSGTVTAGCGGNVASCEAAETDLLSEIVAVETQSWEVLL